jgi:hypothetical protein
MFFQTSVRSETSLGIDDELHVLDGLITVDRKGKIDMQNISERGPTVTQPKSDPDIRQNTLGLAGIGVTPPSVAYVDECSSAHMHESERIPVGEGALLHREKPATLPPLVAQRETPQSRIPTEHQLTIDIEFLAAVDVERCEKQSAIGLAMVVAG